MKTQTLTSALMSFIENGLDNEMTFKEDNNKTRLAVWTGEELSQSSLRKNLKEAKLLQFEKELKSLQRAKLLKMVLDDGWLHLTFSNHLLSESFFKEVTFD